MYCLLSFCCVCLSDREELQSLSNTDVDNVQLLDKLNFCAFETEWIQSNFPIFICYKCCHSLRIAYEFKRMCHKNNKLLRGYVSQLNVTESMESLHSDRCSVLKDTKQSTMDMKVVQDTEIAQYCKTELDYSPARSSTVRQNEEEVLSVKEAMSKRLQTEDKSLANLVACTDSLSNKSNMHDAPYVKDELGILDYGIRNQFLVCADYTDSFNQDHEQQYGQFGSKYQPTLVSHNVEITKPVTIPMYKHVTVPVPYAVPVPVPKPVVIPVPQPYQVQILVPHAVPIPVIKTINLPIQKEIPVAVEKEVPYHYEKLVPFHVEVPRPYPVHVPVYKHIYLDSKPKEMQKYQMIKRVTY
ncbi:hypothetical protein CBL_10141 [Carabus blaptoides fortunei]